MQVQKVCYLSRKGDCIHQGDQGLVVGVIGEVEVAVVSVVALREIPPDKGVPVFRLFP